VYLTFGLEISASSSLELKQVLVVYLDVQQQSGNLEDSIHHSKTEDTINLCDLLSLDFKMYLDN